MSDRQALGPFELLAFAAVAALAVSGLLLWLAGQLAALVFAHTTLQVGATQMGGVVVRTLLDPGHPAQAWPPAAQPGLPGPVGFYGCLFVVLAVVAALFGGGFHAWTSTRERQPGRRPRRGQRAARWAGRRDLRPLRVRLSEVGQRIALGLAGRRLLAAEERASVLVFGPTQSYKSSGLAIPALLEWDGPVVATSVKRDLLDAAMAARAARGPVAVYDPTGSSGIPTDNWSPVASCSTWASARTMAGWLTAAARSRPGERASDDFWDFAGAKLLGPLLLAANLAGQTISTVLAWLEEQAQDEPMAILREHNQVDATRALLATFARDDRQRSGIFSSAEKVLDVYADPKVAASAAGFGLDPAELLTGRATLFLVAPLHEQQRLAPLFVALVSSIVRAAQDRVAWTGRPLSPRLLLLLDEAANIAALPDLDHLASTVAGQGIQLVSVFQDMAQVQQRYGTHRAATVVNNHAATLALAGIKDPATLDHLSRLMGDEAVAERSRTSSEAGGSSTTEHTAYRRLAPLEELRTMRRGSGVLLYGNLPPARVRLRPWFRNRHLRNLAAGTSGGHASTKVGLVRWLRAIRGGAA